MNVEDFCNGHSLFTVMPKYFGKKIEVHQCRPFKIRHAEIEPWSTHHEANALVLL